MPLPLCSWVSSYRKTVVKHIQFFTLSFLLLVVLILSLGWSQRSDMKSVKDNRTKSWQIQPSVAKQAQYNIHCDLYDVDWDALLASDVLTGDEIVQYFLWTNHSSCQLSHDFGGVMMNNPSGLAGQKAVCIDPKIAPEPGNCLVYSFGINNEWSFDEKMASYGCEVFAFDPSMGLEVHDHSPGNVHFYNWGLGDRNEFDNRFNWTIRSLSTIYDTLSVLHGKKTIDYLKIDIEYSEWIALPDIIASGMLPKIRQLGMEIHLDNDDSLERIYQKAKLLRGLENMGMIRFDSEYNPWFVGNFTQFSLTASLGYEIAWYNSKLLHNLA